MIGWAPAPRTVAIDGRTFVAFSPEDAERILFELERTRKIEAALRAAESVIVRQAKHVATSSASLVLTQRLLESERERANHAAMGMLDGQPIFWLSIGAIVSAIGTVLLVERWR